MPHPHCIMHSASSTFPPPPVQTSNNLLILTVLTSLSKWTEIIDPRGTLVACSLGSLLMTWSFRLSEELASEEEEVTSLVDRRLWDRAGRYMVEKRKEGERKGV